MTRHDLLIQTAATHRRPTGSFVPGATATSIMHATKLKAELGFVPRYTFASAFAEIRTWYAAQLARGGTGWTRVTETRTSP